MAQVRIIKKYPNRRLYDTEISSYITLEEVRQLVLDGEEFEVRDAKTGEDLTRSVLLQIILEQQQKFRSQLNNILGQTPWSMLNELTERNMDLWKSVQEGFLNAAAGSAKAKSDGKEPKA